MTTDLAALLPLQVCPIAPGNAAQYVDQITGYVLWGVGVLFLIAIVVGLGAVLAGRVFGMPHASKVGIISLVVVFIAAIAYLTLPGMLTALLGAGCINTSTPAATPSP